MDPNTALQDARNALFTARNTPGGEDGDDMELAALRDLRDAFESLDEWLAKGGFLPLAWSPTSTDDGSDSKFCKNCRARISQDSDGVWEHAAECPEGSACYEGMRGAEPEDDAFGLPAGEWNGAHCRVCNKPYHATFEGMDLCIDHYDMLAR